MEALYLEALKEEIRAHAWQWTPETIYLGGGTPGNLALAALRGILEGIPGRPWIEATIESAPAVSPPKKPARGPRAASIA